MFQRSRNPDGPDGTNPGVDNTYAEQYKAAVASSIFRDNTASESIEIADNINIHGAELHGGAHKIGSLYSVYWSIMTSAKDACTNPQRAKALGDSPLIKNFLVDTAQMSPMYETPPSANANIAFKSLLPAMQNLLMAIGDVNMKLNNVEEGLNQSLSTDYLLVARAAQICILKICEQTLQYENQKKEKTRVLYLNAAQEIMGNKYADFTKGALQTMHKWNEVSERITVAHIDSLSLDTFRSLHIEIDSSSPEGILQGLFAIRRQMDFLIESFHNYKQPIASNDMIDSRMNLRMQKHDIAKRKLDEMSKITNSFELANALRLLNVADMDLQTSIDSLDVPKVETKPTIDFKGLVGGYKPKILDLIERGNLLQAEANILKEAISKQIHEELKLDFDIAMNTATSCLNLAKQKLSEQNSIALSKQSSAVKDLRATESVLAKELNAMIKVGDGTALETCAKALSTAARQRRFNRDISALNEHKRELHGFVLKVQMALKKL